MKARAAFIAAAAFAMAGATAAQAADVVIFEQSGTTTSLNLSDSLPDGPGQFKFELTSSDPSITVFLEGAYDYHWDVFYAPPPKPHAQNIEGNEYEDIVEFNALGVHIFTVPETTYTFFNSNAYYQTLGVPLGTPLYREEKYEDPRFYLSAFGRTAFDYTFRITQLDTAAVPEPGTWALMILGLGTAGAALRSRRRQLA